MKNLPILLLIVAVAVIVYLIVQPVPPGPDVKPYRDTIELKKKLIDSMLKRQEKLRLEIYQDSIEAAENDFRFNKQIAALKEKLAKTSLQQATAPELDSIRERLYTQSSDTMYTMHINHARNALESAVREPILQTLLQVNEEQNKELQARNDRLFREFNRYMDVSDQKYDAQVAISENYKAMGYAFEKENKKLRKGAKLLKIAVPVAFVLCLAVGL